MTDLEIGQDDDIRPVSHLLEVFTGRFAHGHGDPVGLRTSA